MNKLDDRACPAPNRNDWAIGHGVHIPMWLLRVVSVFILIGFVSTGCGTPESPTPAPPATATTVSGTIPVPSVPTDTAIAPGADTATNTPVLPNEPTGEPCPTAIPPQDSAVVMKILGEAFACPHSEGCSDSATQGLSVYTDGEARTGSAANMVLQSTTTVFDMQERATLRFQRISNGVQQIFLKLGRLFVAHDPCGLDKLVIQAGDTTVEAVDTDFIVDYNGGITLVSVVTGTLRVSVPTSTLVLDSRTTYTRLVIPQGVQKLPTPAKITPVEQKTYLQRKVEWLKIPNINPKIFNRGIVLPRQFIQPPRPSETVAP